MSVIERRWTLHAVNEDNRRTANAMVSGPMIGPGDDAVEVVPADQLQGAVDRVIADDDAMRRARRAYLNSPPYNGKHDETARLEHMRAAFRAAFGGQ